MYYKKLETVFVACEKKIPRFPQALSGIFGHEPELYRGVFLA